MFSCEEYKIVPHVRKTLIFVCYCMCLFPLFQPCQLKIFSVVFCFVVGKKKMGFSFSPNYGATLIIVTGIYFFAGF